MFNSKLNTFEKLLRDAAASRHEAVDLSIIADLGESLESAESGELQPGVPVVAL